MNGATALMSVDQPENLAAANLTGRLVPLLVHARSTGQAADELQRRLRQLPHEPGLTIDVACQRNPEGGPPDIDVLVTEAGVGTFLICFAPEDVQPWVLRGAEREDSSRLLTVADEPIDVADAVTSLELLWNDPTISRRIVADALTRRELRRNPISLTEDEVQDYVVRFRRTRGLLSAEAFTRWLGERALTVEQFQQQVREHALRFALRRRITHDAPAYFEAHRADFDEITAARWWFPDAGAAAALRTRLEGGADLWQLLEEMARSSDRSALPCPELIRQPAGELPREVRAAAAEGERLIGPLVERARPAGQPEEGFSLYRIVHRRPAQLDARTLAAVEEKIWQAWLSKLRAEVSVTWHWGPQDSGGSSQRAEAR